MLGYSTTCSAKLTPEALRLSQHLLILKRLLMLQSTLPLKPASLFARGCKTALDAQGTSPQKLVNQESATDSLTVDDAEMQEVQNLPFDSAKLKAQHFHWSDRCSKGIQQMLAGRRQRHEAALQAFMSTR